MQIVKVLDLIHIGRKCHFTKKCKFIKLNILIEYSILHCLFVISCCTSQAVEIKFLAAVDQRFLGRCGVGTVTRRDAYHDL